MKCPRCNHEIRRESSNCPDCGYELQDTWWPVNPNVFQGWSSHARSASAREIYLYLTGFKELVKRCGVRKILLALGVILVVIIVVGIIVG